LKKVKFDVLDALPDIVGLARTRHPGYAERLDQHQLAAEIRGRPRPGPKGPTDKDLARLARQYTRLIRQRCANPNRLLAERRERGETPERIRDLVLAFGESDIRLLVESVHDKVLMLADADREQKAAVYADLGIRLVYDPAEHLVKVETNPTEVCRNERVGGGT
jgi:hypothetical protein